jgi:4-hydroxyphenylpyruvate dioxygenase-like putative hemolysin
MLLEPCSLFFVCYMMFDWHRRKSQIQTYLEQNEGAGLQHLALKTDDIFETLTQMREAEENLSGFDLMQRPSDGYYRELPERLGELLTVSLGASCAQLSFSGEHS